MTETAAQYLDQQQTWIKQVPDAMIDQVWELFLPKIWAGLAHGQGDCTTADHLLEAIKMGKAWLWGIYVAGELTAIAVISVLAWPAKRTLFVELVAGRDLHLWLSAINQALRQTAKAVEADTIEASCRLGLTRELAGSWRVKAYQMELEQ